MGRALTSHTRASASSDSAHFTCIDASCIIYDSARFAAIKQPCNWQPVASAVNVGSSISTQLSLPICAFHHSLLAATYVIHISKNSNVTSVILSSKTRHFFIFNTLHSHRFLSVLLNIPMTLLSLENYHKFSLLYFRYRLSTRQLPFGVCTGG